MILNVRQATSIYICIDNFAKKLYSEGLIFHRGALLITKNAQNNSLDSWTKSACIHQLRRYNSKLLQKARCISHRLLFIDNPISTFIREEIGQGYEIFICINLNIIINIFDENSSKNMDKFRLCLFYRESFFPFFWKEFRSKYLQEARRKLIIEIVACMFFEISF